MPLAHNTNIIDPIDEIIENTQWTHNDWLWVILKILQKGWISLLNFILYILQSKPDKSNSIATYWDCFFNNPSSKLIKLLDCIIEDKQGYALMLLWMEPHAIRLVSDKVSKEMDAIKTALTWSINTTTPESLLTWNVDVFISPLVDNNAPTLGHILQAATQCKHAKEVNKIKSCTTIWISFLPRY